MIVSMPSTLPPFVPGYGGLALTAAQVLVTLSSFSNEANPSTRTPYSKFAQQITSSSSVAAGTSKSPASSDATPERKKAMVSSRTGMMIIYTPALIVSVAILALGSSIDYIPNPSPAGILCIIHFAKRVLEVLFLHKYSGSVEKAVSTTIGTYYALVTLLMCSVAEINPPGWAQMVGTVLFGIGIAGNWWHHYLLANLRRGGDKGDSNGGTKRYVAPRDGLFDYVAAPHYFFELIGWLGMATVAWHFNAYLVFASMCSYLGGRAVAQNDWNRQKFPEEEWPESRKNIIPFIF